MATSGAMYFGDPQQTVEKHSSVAIPKSIILNAPGPKITYFKVIIPSTMAPVMNFKSEGATPTISAKP